MFKLFRNEPLATFTPFKRVKRPIILFVGDGYNAGIRSIAVSGATPGDARYP